MRSSSGGGASYSNLAYAVFYREVVNWLRYPVNAAGVVIGQLLMFALLFFGGRAVFGEAFAGSIGSVVVGYFLWSLAGQSYEGIVSIISQEASWGTLERHFLSPFGFERVLLMKAFARVVRSFAVSVLIFGVMLLVTGMRPTIPVLTVLVILACTVLSVVGVGFVMGGLAVLYKRISSFVQLFSLVILGLVGAPVLEVPWLRYLPVVQGSTMLQQSVRGGIPLWEFGPQSLAILVAVAGGYFALGLAGFHVIQRRARRLGVLGDY
ncbi:ABC transporter permease [Halopelagius longus]|uniref:ABC transporter permease n=1 Tax=Halopelagius longus TaxID=1236180 RepID=A0A1H1G503_9EURY|nr:ABC transporter permease [Halopelagius longus]RDI69838.1 ABC transporter permease [Halopelagius longus]SDR08327.1 ABC-2 type transport system permease protein [Halopelagius longus]